MLRTLYNSEVMLYESTMAPSSSGLGHWPFTPAARVQIPLGSPNVENNGVAVVRNAR